MRPRRQKAGGGGGEEPQPSTSKALGGREGIRKRQKTGNGGPGGVGGKEEKVPLKKGRKGVVEVVPRKSQYERDSQDLLSQFPAEIWEMIITYSQCQAAPADLLHLSNASPYFRAFLKPSRTHFLFPSVLKILQDHPLGNLGSDILTCRLVSPSWNTAVQNYYQDHPANFDISPQSPSNPDPLKHSGVKLGYSGNIRDFLLSLKPTHSNDLETTSQNPFLGRAVSFLIPRIGSRPPAALDPAQPPLNPGRNATPRSNLIPGLVGSLNRLSRGLANLSASLNELNNNFNELHENFNRLYASLDIYIVRSTKTAITDLLGIYGSHLWYATFDLPNNPEGQVNTDHYLALRTWLQATPNLKTLKLSFQGTVPPTAEQNAELARTISRFPLPKLEGLEYLKADNLPAPLFIEVLRKNPQLSKLQVVPRHGYVIGPLPNLKGLSVTFPLAKHLLGFECAQVGSWALEELYLTHTILNCPHSEFVPWSRVWKMIETNWASTLKRVELQLPEPKEAADHKSCLEESASFSWDLPKVTHLKITMPSPASVDFLGGLRGLEELHVVVKEGLFGKKRTALHKKVQAGQKMQFLGFTGRMGKSNIWKKMGGLKKLRITRGKEELSYDRPDKLKEN